jgi:hypothetical protein
MSLKHYAAAGLSLLLTTSSIGAQESEPVNDAPVQGLGTYVKEPISSAQFFRGNFADMKACLNQSMSYALYVRGPFRWECKNSSAKTSITATYPGQS